MSSARWSEEQLAAYERRLKRDGWSLGSYGVSEARREANAAATLAGAQAPNGRGRGAGARGAGSPLEHELTGHLLVMQLRPELQFRFHPERRWRLDFAFPDVRVGVELDGGIFAAENGGEIGKHARGAGRCADMEKRNAAAELGWLILNYGPPHVRTGEAALQIERIITARRRVSIAAP